MLLSTQYKTIRGLLLSAVTVSLHYLPRCLCSAVTCRAPIQWFQINPDCTPKIPHSYNKNPESLCYEQKHMSVLIWTETIIKYRFNYSSSSKFSSAAKTLTSGWLFVAQDIFHNAGNTLRWRYLSLIVGVHLLLN